MVLSNPFCHIGLNTQNVNENFAYLYGCCCGCWCLFLLLSPLLLKTLGGEHPISNWFPALLLIHLMRLFEDRPLGLLFALHAISAWHDSSSAYSLYHNALLVKFRSTIKCILGHLIFKGNESWEERGGVSNCYQARRPKYPQFAL